MPVACWWRGLAGGAAGLALAVVGCRRPESPPVPRPPDDMVTIPAGPFRTGCDVRQGCYPDKRGPVLPIHDASLPVFEIDRVEVSVANYQACWRAGYCEVANDRVLVLAAEQRGAAARSQGDPYYKPMPIFTGVDPRLPMWNVSAYEARVYCAWVHKRLPTALEWEKAARGTDGRAYPWGNEPPTHERTSNAHWNHWLDPGGFPLPVGSQPAGASPYGVLDMAGSVREFVETDADDPDVILIAGGHPMAEVAPINLVLPQLGVANSIYGRNTEPTVGFRCARSVAAPPTQAAAP